MGGSLGGLDKITMDFTGGHQNESMLAYLFRVLLTSFQPPGRSPEEVVRPASHALPTPSWESTQRKIVIAPKSWPKAPAREAAHTHTHTHTCVLCVCVVSP